MCRVPVSFAAGSLCTGVLIRFIPYRIITKSAQVVNRTRIRLVICVYTIQKNVDSIPESMEKRVKIMTIEDPNPCKNSPVKIYAILRMYTIYGIQHLVVSTGGASFYGARLPPLPDAYLHWCNRNGFWSCSNCNFYVYSENIDHNE